MSWETPDPESTAKLMTSLVDMMRATKKAFFATNPTWGIGFSVSVERPSAWTNPWVVQLDLWPEPHPAMPDELL